MIEQRASLPHYFAIHRESEIISIFCLHHKERKHALIFEWLLCIPSAEYLGCNLAPESKLITAWPEDDRIGVA